MDHVRTLACAIANCPKMVNNEHDILVVRSLAANLQEAPTEIQSLSHSARSQTGSSNRNDDHRACQANGLPQRNVFDKLALVERN